MTALSITLPTVGGSEDTWGTTLNADLQAISDFIGPLDSTELAVLDGITATTAQLNATATFTAAGLALMDDVDAAAQRVTLELGTAATTAATDYATAAQGALADLAAPLASPTFTGVPIAPTAAAATNTTQIATTAYTRTAIPNVLNASGSAPIYACRAWVNFNGTGTVAIREAGNVSSITDLGTGNYRINFATAMPDANYAALASSDGGSRPAATTSLTASSVTVETASGGSSTTPEDRIFISVAVFR